jgi:carbonic anhydrase
MVERWGSRRAVAVAFLVVLAVAPVSAADSDAITPAQAVARLKAGNAVFVTHPEDPLPITAAARRALADGQAPFAAVLSCADSRVPPEVIFHAGLGELFVVRSAGHVADRSVLASLEYAADHLHVALVVVMGHESCGAVRAAADAATSAPEAGPNLDFLLKAIRPAIAAAASAPEAIRLRTAILDNVENTVNDLLDDSPTLRHLAESGGIGLVGAYYELSTGRVYFSEPVTVALQARAGDGR